MMFKLLVKEKIQFYAEKFAQQDLYLVVLVLAPQNKVLGKVLLSVQPKS